MHPFKISKIFTIVLLIWAILFVALAVTVQFFVLRGRLQQEFEDFKSITLGLTEKVFLDVQDPNQLKNLLSFLQTVKTPRWFIGVRVISGSSDQDDVNFLRLGDEWKQHAEVPSGLQKEVQVLRREVSHPLWSAIELFFANNELTNRATSALVSTLSYLALFAGASALVGYYVLKRNVVRSLKSLKTDMTRFGNDVRYRLPRYPVQEFEEVAQEFNAMADKLYKSQEDVQFLTNLSQEVFNFIDQPLLITEGNILITYNLAAETFFGLSRVDCSRPVDHFNQTIDKLLRKAASEHVHRSSVIERRVKLKATSNRLYDIHLTKVKGKSNFFAVQIIDVTEMDRAEKVQKVQSQAEMLALVAGGVVHDLNNILSGLTGTTSILKYLIESNSVIESSALKDKIALLEACSSRAVHLSQSLLHLSTRRDIEYKAFDLNQAILNALTIAQSNAGTGVVFQQEGPPSPVYVMGDIARTEQIILNLLINSIHALGVMAGKEAAEGLIRLKVQRLSPQGILPAMFPELKKESYVRLRVTDNGVGIPNEIQKLIFEPFFTTKSRETGSGLGLSLVLSGMILQKGWLNLFSKPGLGTCFDLYFVPQDAVAPPSRKPLKLMFCNQTIPITEDLLAAYQEENIELDLYEDLPDSVSWDGYDGLLIDSSFLLEEPSPIVSGYLSERKAIVVCQCPEIMKIPGVSAAHVISFPFLWEDLVQVF